MNKWIPQILQDFVPTGHVWLKQYIWERIREQVCTQEEKHWPGVAFSLAAAQKNAQVNNLMYQQTFEFIHQETADVTVCYLFLKLPT